MTRRMLVCVVLCSLGKGRHHGAACPVCVCTCPCCVPSTTFLPCIASFILPLPSPTTPTPSTTHLLLLGTVLTGPKPHELYGKFTWKIGNFSDISKRELRSTTFDVGGYKWCGIRIASTPRILGATHLPCVLESKLCSPVLCLHCCGPVCRYVLIYPQGCDVCNHLSLFLCVADYDKLLPGACGAGIQTGTRRNTQQDPGRASF